VGLTPTEHPSLTWTHSLPRIRFSRNHGNLSRPVPSRGTLRPGSGMGLTVSTEAVERLETRE
jgi:hypothetical protein